MSNLNLAKALAIIDVALAEGRKRNFAPLAAAVLDAGGHVIAFKREDGASFLRFEIANGKAWGSLGLGFGTREIAERAAKLPTFIATLSTTSQGRVIPSPGGVLIADASGALIGAIGVSGDIGDNDEICAIAGIEAAGFKAIPGMKPK
ncbi:MAG TPA: heme-binding protein [Verrucomicrobiae bacterium]|nr:heme-binding protein [Verrucomicrobiae bacterium]